MRRTPSQIFFKYLASILRTLFSITSLNRCFQNNLPHMSNFSLGLLRPFAVSFCIYKIETTHSRDILLPNVMLWVLMLSVFSVLFNFINFYSTKSKFFFLLLYFQKFNIYFVLKICVIFISNFWLVESTCSITFREKIIYDESEK